MDLASIYETKRGEPNAQAKRRGLHVGQKVFLPPSGKMVSLPAFDNKQVTQGEFTIQGFRSDSAVLTHPEISPNSFDAPIDHILTAKEYLTYELTTFGTKECQKPKNVRWLDDKQKLIEKIREIASEEPITQYISGDAILKAVKMIYPMHYPWIMKQIGEPLRESSVSKVIDTKKRKIQNEIDTHGLEPGKKVYIDIYTNSDIHGKKVGALFDAGKYFVVTQGEFEVVEVDLISGIALCKHPEVPNRFTHSPTHSTFDAHGFLMEIFFHSQLHPERLNKSNILSELKVWRDKLQFEWICHAIKSLYPMSWPWFERELNKPDTIKEAKFRKPRRYIPLKDRPERNERFKLIKVRDLKPGLDVWLNNLIIGRASMRPVGDGLTKVLDQGKFKIDSIDRDGWIILTHEDKPGEKFIIDPKGVDSDRSWLTKWLLTRPSGPSDINDKQSILKALQRTNDDWRELVLTRVIKRIWPMHYAWFERNSQPVQEAQDGMKPSKPIGGEARKVYLTGMKKRNFKIIQERDLKVGDEVLYDFELGKELRVFRIIRISGAGKVFIKYAGYMNKEGKFLLYEQDRTWDVEPTSLQHPRNWLENWLVRLHGLTLNDKPQIAELAKQYKNPMRAQLLWIFKQVFPMHMAWFERQIEG